MTAEQEQTLFNRIGGMASKQLPNITKNIIMKNKITFFLPAFLASN